MSVNSQIEFFNNWGKLIAAILFVIAASSDWLDGFIARRCNMVTNTGKLLDPVADKMLTVLGFVLVLGDPVWRQFGLASTDAFSFWFVATAVFIALGRDIIMNSLRFIAAEQGITMAADGMGKMKSITQYIAITMYMIFAFNQNPAVQFCEFESIWYDIFGWGCVFALTAATVLSVWSCCNYIGQYVRQSLAKTKAVEQKEKEKDGKN